MARTGTGRDGAKVMRLAISADAGREFVAFLRKMLPRARKLVRGPLSELSLAIVGSRRMAELHQRFMGLAGPTDVLTFELEHDRRGRVTSGEVVICLPVARKQARQFGHDPRMELLLYAIHGMLHLCGFDDRSAADFRRMHAMEDSVLKALGLAPMCVGRERRPGRAASAAAGGKSGPLRRGGRPCC
jgi:rRNA maturation RNase YbeY